MLTINARNLVLILLIANLPGECGLDGRVLFEIHILPPWVRQRKSNDGIVEFTMPGGTPTDETPPARLVQGACGR